MARRSLSLQGFSGPFCPMEGETPSSRLLQLRDCQSGAEALAWASAWRDSSPALLCDFLPRLLTMEHMMRIYVDVKRARIDLCSLMDMLCLGPSDGSAEPRG
ncbi:MAG: hypothetical protein HN742_34125 [Lentisphaerae bacterium]|jgi:hypothetical protein|nr:hypothetical protein [Lentisphaerota bacterium]MBT5612916.1 hypothetical protein [Lentisphaerota bacterium]MBT7061866.1 hypothetical protein [Lentisphaerota bacterium]MBT7846960.1 hypothetical protein [Lentisphaerota bacterium]